MLAVDTDPRSGLPKGRPGSHACFGRMWKMAMTPSLPLRLVCPAADRRQVECSGSGIPVASARRYRFRSALNEAAAITRAFKQRGRIGRVGHRPVLPCRAMAARKHSGAAAAEALAMRNIAAGGLELARRVRALAARLDAKAADWVAPADSNRTARELIYAAARSRTYREAADLVRALLAPASAVDAMK